MMEGVGDVGQALAHGVFSISDGPNSMMEIACSAVDPWCIISRESQPMSLTARGKMSASTTLRPHFTRILASRITI